MKKSDTIADSIAKEILGRMFIDGYKVNHDYDEVILWFVERFKAKTKERR